MADKTRGDDSTTLLDQPDLGGGQAAPTAPSPTGRPQGTAPVGRYAGEGGEWPPIATGEPWKVFPGEAEAATEDGFPGDDALRSADALEAAGVLPGEEEEPVRGALYEGPERRKEQADWGWWQCEDRRVRPFAYAGQQQGS